MSRIIGIDLGTSTSEVACVIDGRPVVIPNSQGKGITPSVVNIGEDGEIIVGEVAAEYLLTRPDCTFMEVKRLTGSGAVLTAHGKKYSPEDVQAMLLRYLASCSSEFLGEEVTRAVITVPAYFTDAQRRECKNVLVYDFGGGTLDVTVLELFEGVIDVKASSVKILRPPGSQGRIGEIP